MAAKTVCVARENAAAPAQRAALDHLTGDFAEALPVYARLSDTEAPQLVWARTGRDVERGETVLLAWSLEEGAPPTPPLAAYARPGARVYALVVTASPDDPSLAAHALAELEELCELHGQSWMGALVVGDAEVVTRFSHSPRMGWARRRISEALDQLICALLAGTSTGEKYVRPPLAARLAARLLPA